MRKDVDDVFQECFGRTPLKLRLEDIMGETLELTRFTDYKNLKEETGDLLCSVIQLANENDWDIEELIKTTLTKIQSRKTQYLSLGRKIKVAILGGAFDPIHDGHIKLAQFVLDTSKTFDEVWLMPCYQHMHGKNLSPAEDRLKMCELAAKVDGRIKVSDYEIKNKLSGETFNLVTRLQDEDFAKNKYDFSMIIGQDNANTFDSWVNYEHLERLIRFVVVPRKGDTPQGKWYMEKPHIYLNAETNIPSISSTIVRDMIKKDAVNVRKHMNIEVLEHIFNKQLYK